jgi:hypothetical protein
MEFSAVFDEVSPLRNDLGDWKRDFDDSISTMQNGIVLEAARMMDVINRNKDDLMEHLNTLKKNVTDEIGVVEVDFGRKLFQLQLFLRRCSQVINEESLDDVVHQYEDLSSMAQELRRPLGHKLKMTFGRWTFATMDSELPSPPAAVAGQRNWVGRIARKDSEEDRAKQRKMFMADQEESDDDDDDDDDDQNEFAGANTADVGAREDSNSKNRASNRRLRRMEEEKQLRNRPLLRLAEMQNGNNADKSVCPTVSESVSFKDLFI